MIDDSIQDVRRIIRSARRSVRGLVWTALYPLVTDMWWNCKVPKVYQAWADATDDHSVLIDIFRRYGIATVLDIGCGAGRLFPLYAAHGIAAVGTDISARALAIARARVGTIPTIRASLVSVRSEALPRVDLVVSNRVLQHIPRRYVGRVVATIAHVTDLIYLNERTPDEGRPERTETGFLLCHDYTHLFAAHGFRRCEDGNIGGQKWILLSRPSVKADSKRGS